MNVRARLSRDDAPETRSLLEIRRKLYPRAVSGAFARWRWTMVWITQLVFYALPWLTWNDRQAVLFDLGARRFHLLGLVLHPQDFIYLTALLIVSAMSLFLFTTVAGRLWCGYACPQTVYTEIFLWIERRVEGDRGRRMKLDRAPMSATKLRLKATKHALWFAVALWTGITFVGYFTPIRELVLAAAAFSLGPWQTFWVLFYGVATWGNAGFMREQVCKYMCPYARFQGVMVDRDTLVITYDDVRGEPRGARSRKAAAAGGDCVDCSLCVQVCPTGIDIRDGQQYECIGCAACIDACDQVMDKVGSPRGLIRYDTLNGIEQRLDRGTLLRRVLRPRVVLYAGILAAVTITLGVSLLTRVPLKVDVMRDRGALAREVENGLIENTYRLLVANGTERERTFVLDVSGLPGIAIDTGTTLRVESSANRLVAVRVRAAPAAGTRGSSAIVFEVAAADDPTVRREVDASFYVPDVP